MKSTGIIRRIDDLGRIAIPKEVRRVLKIKEGDPLEIFTEKDGSICLKKYDPIGEKDWNMAGMLVKDIVSCPWALFDRYEKGLCGDPSIFNHPLDEVITSANLIVNKIEKGGEILAFLVVTRDYNTAEVVIARKVLKTLLGEEF